MAQNVPMKTLPYATARTKSNSRITPSSSAVMSLMSLDFLRPKPTRNFSASIFIVYKSEPITKSRCHNQEYSSLDADAQCCFDPRSSINKDVRIRCICPGNTAPSGAKRNPPPYRSNSRVAVFPRWISGEINSRPCKSHKVQGSIGNQSVQVIKSSIRVISYN